MLIGPIFKVDYLPKQPDTQSSQIRDVSSTSILNTSGNSSTYNIFKTAINRGTQLIKSTFLSKSSACSTAPNTSLPKEVEKETEDYETESSSSSESEEESDSDSSSPDSIQTELMYFKPIVSEPRSNSSNATKILRVPSVRSTSSSSTNAVHTPCPSPFFIPIFSQRQSAFSFVAHNLTDDKVKAGRKPKNAKRKPATCETTSNKKAERAPTPKRSRTQTNRYSKTKTDAQTTKETTKRGTRQAKQAATKSNDTDFRRVTRSMKN